MKTEIYSGMESMSMINKGKICLYCLGFLVIILLFSTCSGKKDSYIENAAKNPENSYQIGAIYLSDGNYLQAEIEFKRAISLDPNNPKYHNALGLAYLFSNRLYHATEAFKRALSFAPNEPDYHNNLGTAYMEMGEHDLAKDEYMQVAQVTSYPALFKTYFNIGQIYAEEKNFPEAINYFQKSLQLNPNSPYTHTQLGLVYEQANKPGNAAKQYKEALRLDSDFIPANYNLGILMFKKGMRVEAKQYFQKVIQKRPNSEMGEKAKEFLNLISSE